jgi:O-antigen/teichoic acid export membrane protein
MSSDRIVKNTMVLYLRTFVTLIVSLFTSRITLDVLGIEGWGLYNVVGGFVALFAVMNSSLGLAAQRFLTMAIAKEENVGNVLAHSIRIHVVLAVVVMVVAEIIGTYYIYNQLNVPVNKRTLAFWVFQMSLISLAFSTLSVPFNSLLSSYERLDIFAYIEIGNVFLRLGIVYLLYLFSDRLLLYAICGAIISFLIYVIYRICCWRMFFSMHRLRFEINKKLLKEMLSFSGWTIMSSMAWLCRDQGLAVLLNAFMGLTVNAAYGMARQINMAVTKLTQNIVLVFVPIITKSYAVNDLKKTEKTLIASSKFGSILIMLAFVPIFFNIDFILSVWLKEVPSGTAMITVYILFMAVIICLFGNKSNLSKIVYIMI